MNRRQYVENIIIGTLLESNEEDNYFDDCRCLVQDMFLDDRNRRVFAIVQEMNGRGEVCTDPCSIFNEYGNRVADICIHMMEVCTYYSFIRLKTDYNERRFIRACLDGTEYKYTAVQFSDYVRLFIKLVYGEAEANN